jgi:hypothetical protein
MANSLPPPPKFGTPKTGPAPTSIYDWVTFLRWLWQMFRVTQETASITQSTSQFPLPPVRTPGSIDAAAIAASIGPGSPRRLDELTAPVLMALSKPPYPQHAASAAVIEDTHANRSTYSAAAFVDWFYFETDTLVLYLSVAGAWQYAGGYDLRTQAQLAAYAATLTAADVGTLVWVSDYAHMLKWTGAAWTRGPGDPEHSDTFQIFGAAPTDTGWHACDGSTVNFLKYDGTLGSRTLPNTNATPAYVILASTYSATITAAVVPTFAGTLDTTSAVSAGTPSGTNSTPTFSGNTLPAHTHDAPIGDNGGLTGMFSLSVNGTGGSYTALSKAVSVADASTINALVTSNNNSALTPSGSVSAPVFTGNALGTHTHTVTPTGTIALPGDPIANWQGILFYRQ